MTPIDSINRLNLINDDIEKLSAIQYNWDLFESKDTENYLEIISKVTDGARNGDKNEYHFNDTFIKEFHFNNTFVEGFIFQFFMILKMKINKTLHLMLFPLRNKYKWIHI